jgi:hypothetical protein
MPSRLFVDMQQNCNWQVMPKWEGVIEVHKSTRRHNWISTVKTNKHINLEAFVSNRIETTKDACYNNEKWKWLSMKWQKVGKCRTFSRFRPTSIQYHDSSLPTTEISQKVVPQVVQLSDSTRYSEHWRAYSLWIHQRHWEAKLYALVLFSKTLSCLAWVFLAPFCGIEQ